MRPSPRNLERLVEEQVQRWNLEQHPPESGTPLIHVACPIVTLSRQAGAHGTGVANRVATRLGFVVWDRELVKRVAARIGATERQLAVVDERDLNAVEDLLAGVLMGDTASGEGYVERLRPVIRSIAQRGNAVVVGRGAQYVVPAGGALRVRVVGTVATRVRNMMADAGLDEREAKARVMQVDRERLAFVRHRYKRDASRPDGYDLVVNTSTLSLDQAADVIVGAYRAKFGPEVH